MLRGDEPWVNEILAGLEPKPPVFSSPSLKDFAAVIAAGRGLYHPRGWAHAFRGGGTQAHGGNVVQHPALQLAALGR